MLLPPLSCLQPSTACSHIASRALCHCPTAPSHALLTLFPPFQPLSSCSQPRHLPTTYCLLRSLVEHSYINPKSLAFGHLDEKPIDTGLMKFLGPCPSALS
ncbi:hypothetical protein GW17_00053431 [Ensete ventricosum]|nr:hypothetical protein GW17_00053431 [Ensete ventricosum]RZS27506.1 hypothetical protein BHM03_00060989 [Ensete ventricosum]